MAFTGGTESACLYTCLRTAGDLQLWVQVGLSLTLGVRKAMHFPVCAPTVV